jgi:hypothetical protein
VTGPEKVELLEDCLFYWGAHVSGLHLEPGQDGEIRKVRIFLSNDMIISARLSDLEITKLRRVPWDVKAS